LFADFCLAKGSDVCPSDIGTQTRFTLSASPVSAFVLRGSGTNCTVTLSTNTGFGGPVSFSLSGLPANTGASFNPTSLSGVGAAQLNIVTSNSTPLGAYLLTVTGKASNFTNTATATLIVDTNTSTSAGSLVAHLTFDDGTAGDSSGYDNDGTLNGGATIVDDLQRGKVLSLDGASGYVDLGNASSLDLSGDAQATSASWVKVALSHSHNTIMSKGEWKDAYSLLVKGDTAPKDQLWTGNDTSVFSATPVPTNAWTHVAVIINSNLTTFYLNGQLSGATNQNRGSAIDNTTNNVCLGREQYSGSLPAGRWFFNGLLDDVRLYKRALTQAEIQVLAAVPPPRIVSVGVSGANLVFSGTNGVASASYYVLTSTSVALPWSNWTRVATNQFAADGSFVCTNALSPGAPQRFYLLQLP